MSYSEFLKEIRKNQKLTQEQLAEMIGISRNGVKYIENNNNSKPSMKSIESIAKFLNTSIEEVILKIFAVKGFNDRFFKKKPLSAFNFYMARLYLNSWNIFFDYPLKTINGSITVTGYATKKQQLLHKIIVEPFEYLEKECNVDILENPLQKMHPIVKAAEKSRICTDDVIREFHIIFNSRTDDSLKKFHLYSENDSVLVRTRIFLILFDPFDRKVETVLKLKKRRSIR